MEVIKSDGSRAEFDIEKVKRSIRNTGASEDLVERVANDVAGEVTDGMTTWDLYRMVFDRLSSESACFACRYNLRSAILRLGPAGFKFEKYVAAILRAYNYEAYVPDEEFEGSCVSHEIDGIAEKDGRRMMIEAKFRNRYSDNVNLKDVMATWSRFIDLVDGAALGKTPKFDEVWIVTNAKFSDRAMQFGVCKGIHLVGWDVPKERSFAGMVDYRALYPVTVLDKLKKSELESLAEHKLLLCRDVMNVEPDELEGKLGFSSARAEELVKMCVDVVEGPGEPGKHTHNK